MVEAFKAGEAAAKDFNSANVTADGGIKEGDYVFVLEKNTYVTANTESQALTGSIPLSSSDNVADDVDGTGANLNRTYAMVQKFKAAPDTLTGVENKTLVKGYLAYLQGKGLEDNLLNFKRYVSIGLAGIAEDQVDAKGRPTRDLTADTSGVSNSDTLELENGGFLLRLNAPSLDVEEYSYRDEITPLRAYRVASGTTTITYTYAEEKTREVEKKGSVVVNYQTEDGTVLKDPYTDTPETVVEVVTEHYYVNADGQEVVVEDKTVKTPKNVTYNTKENETEKPQKLTDAQGNVYYLNEANTKTTVNDQETTSPAETGTVVEGVTKVTYIYEKAGSVIVNYKTEDGTPLTGTVVGDESKTVESGAKDIDNGKPGSEYNTADNGMKPTRITTAEGKVYELVPASTKGNETGDVEAGKTTEVTYVYKEVKEIDKNKNLTPNNPVQPAKPGEETPNNPTQPAKPGEETPNKPAQPAKSGEATNPATPSSPAETAEPGKANPNVATGTTVATKQQELPNTGTGNEVSIFGAAATAILASLGLVIPGKKRDEE